MSQITLQKEAVETTQVREDSGWINMVKVWISKTMDLGYFGGKRYKT